MSKTHRHSDLQTRVEGREVVIRDAQGRTLGQVTTGRRHPRAADRRAAVAMVRAAVDARDTFGGAYL